MPKSDIDLAADAALYAWCYGGRDYGAAFDYALSAAHRGEDPDLAAFYPLQTRDDHPEEPDHAEP